MPNKEIWMQRAFDLALLGSGRVAPNPLVGCVIVKDNRILGEGYHQQYGGPHAEVNAIRSVKDKSLLSKSTLYVSLEPCSHFGKTPPCCDLIIKHKIPNVVIGTVDPNEKVAGNGIKRLLENGANVTVGVLENECNELNKRFFTFHNKKRPYIILKWAESADGFIAPLHRDKKEPVWLSNEFSRQLVHKWRSEEQAILVGTKTVLDDNPKLDVRDWNGKNPIRVVIDRIGKIDSSFYVKDKKTKTIFITEQENISSDENCMYENVIFESRLAEKICAVLYKNNIQSVIIEGGTTTLETFINENLWDEARVFRSKIQLNEGVKSPVLKGNSEATTIQNDELIIFKHHD